MSKKIRYSLLAILMLVMAFGMIGTAAAQDTLPEEGLPLRGRRGLHGEITAIEDNVITLKLRQRSVRIITNDETHFHIIGQEEAGLENFNVGDMILTRGYRQDDDTMLASFILLQPDGDHVRGRIDAVLDDGLLLNGRNEQQIKINTRPETLVVLRGQELEWGGDPAGKDSLEKGMVLVAFGAASEDGLTLDAHTMISYWPWQHRFTFAGQIQAVDVDSFQMTTLRGADLTIITNSDTIFHIGRDNEAELNDFAGGDNIVVIGKPYEGEGTFAAAHVMKRK